MIILLLILLCCIVWCLPLYVVVNLVCWLFHLAFHLSLLQAFVICLLASIIRTLLFKDIEITITKGGKQ